MLKVDEARRFEVEVEMAGLACSPASARNRDTRGLVVGKMGEGDKGKER